MKYLIVITIYLVTACTQHRQAHNKPRLKSAYWISKRFDYYNIDSAMGGGKTVYGSAYLIRLDTNHKVNFLTADFYWKDDSLYLGGEPGIMMKSGDWDIKGSNLLLSQKLVAKTFLMPNDHIGQAEVDTFKISKDGTLTYKGDTLLPLKKPSSELKSFLDRNWAASINNGS